MQIGFEDCLLDTDRRELRRGNELVALEPQVFDVLIYLVENRDRVVSKDDLIASVWSGRIVSESTLTSRINAVRKAIGDSGEKQNLIRTFAKKGFRFVAPVDVKSKETVAPAEPRAPASGMPTKPSIAVLPFSNMSGDADQDSFVDGVTEEIITALSRVRWFFVIARGSTFAYKSSAIGPEEIARELGVRYILMGSVRRAGDRIRVTAQLIDANNRSNVWARSYDRAASDIFSFRMKLPRRLSAVSSPN
jgi:TolB-like protein